MPPATSEIAPARALLALIEEMAREAGRSVPSRGFGLDDRLEADLGLDSLGRAELMARVEQAFGTEMPPEALLATTGRELLGFLSPARTPAAGTRAPAMVPRAADEAGAGGSLVPPDTAETLLDVLDWHRQHHPERVHISIYDTDHEPRAIRYADLAAGAARVAARLDRAGLRSGDKVALMLPTGADYFFGFFGILVAGGVPVPIYPPARLQQLEDHLRRHAAILANAGARFLLTLPQARALAGILRIQVPSLAGVLTLADLEDEVPAAVSARPVADDIALLQYTSGSTGSPKGVILSHADLLANIRAMGAAIGVRDDDVFVSWLPLYHDMGLIGAWLGSLHYGVPLVSLSPLAFLARPIRWLQAIQRHRGTLSAAPNFAYELCLRHIGEAQLSGLDLSSWRWAFNGAEPVSPQTLRRFAARFAACGLRPEALAPVYGLAEAAVGLAFPPAERGPLIDSIDRQRFAADGYALPLPPGHAEAMEIAACGRPLPGYRLRVVDARGRTLPERHEGRLEFQGPSATRGYYRNPEATARLIRDGWHDTGDRAYLAGGDLYLTGRVKDLIIRGGRNLYPYELEAVVGEVEGVRKGCVAAFAVTDPQLGSERLVLIAETHERLPGRLEAIERTVRERATDILGLPPDEVVLAPPGAVPKTSSGKLRRGDARERYLAGRLQAGPSPAWSQLLRVAARGLLAWGQNQLPRLPGGLYAAYAWALLLVIGPWVWVGVMALPRARWRWAVVMAGIGLLRRLAFVRLAVVDVAQVPVSGRPFVLCANHQSYLDGLVLVAAIGRPLRFIAKQELANVPLVGPFLARLDTLFVERFDPRRSAAGAEPIEAALRGGASLAFFAEGTFREQPGLLPFRMGAFMTAARHGVPLLPVAIRGTRELMRGSRFVPRPGRATVVIGPPLLPAGRDWAAATRLRQEARRWILAQCGEEDLDQ